MKYTKMSLVAALLVGSSAFAIDNVKVSGDAKLFYATEEGGMSVTGTSDSIFNKDASAGQVAASLSLTADLTKGISFGGKVTALSTLGLEGQLVNNVWEATNGVTDSYIVNDLWLATTVGKTTVKLGRMELDTPLVFTEKWSIVENTFEAAVVINTDLPNTTLVGAYVGGTNSQAVGGTGAGYAGVVNATANESTFSQFYDGAFAVGVINNSWEPLTAQAWYYDAQSKETVAAGTDLRGVEAFWLQGDVSMDGILAGVQYTSLKLQLTAGAADIDVDTSAFAVMVGYEMKDMFTAKLSYSGVAEDHSAGFNLAGSGKSKLYTEAWWNYGTVTAADTTAINLTVEAPIKDIVDLGFYATMADNEVDAGDMTEVTVTASRSFGPLDTSAALIYADKNDNQSGALQAYLTYNF